MLCSGKPRENEVTDFMDPVNDGKKSLRAAMLARQKALPSDYVQAASDDIQSQLLSSVLYRNAESIFTYISLPQEPSTDRIIRQALADGKQVYVLKPGQSIYYDSIVPHHLASALKKKPCKILAVTYFPA